MNINLKEKIEAVSGFFGIMPPKEWLRSGGIALGCLLVLILCFMLVVAPQSRRLHALRSEEEALKKKSQSYRYFDEFATKMEQQRIKVMSVIEKSNVNLMLSEKTDQNFLDDIGRICKDAFIKLENINPVDNGRAWKIIFSDNFKKIVNFMSLIEKDFKVESFSIVGGEVNREHRVEMTISPLRFNAANAPETDDFMDLFEKTNAMITKIEEQQSVKKEYPALVKDPMYYGDSLVRTVRVVSTSQEPVEEAPPEVSVDGIYYDPVTPVAVIEGKAMREGDTIRGVRIEKIKEKSIVVIWHSKTFTLRQRKGGSE